MSLIINNRDILAGCIATNSKFNNKGTIKGARKILKVHKALYSEVFFLDDEATEFRRKLLIARQKIWSERETYIKLKEDKTVEDNLRRTDITPSLLLEERYADILKRISDSESRLNSYHDIITEKLEIEERLK